MKSLHELTIKKFHDGLVNKEFSALEMTQAHFAQIKEKDPEIKAFLSLAEESAAREAEAVDLKIARDEKIGMLAGVPLAIKDNILIKGLPATAASKILEHYVASYDAGVIQKLKSENVVFLAKRIWMNSRWEVRQKIRRFKRHAIHTTRPAWPAVRRAVQLRRLRITWHLVVWALIRAALFANLRLSVALLA